MEASQCSIDGFSLFGVFFIGIFIALMGGLISKDKEVFRRAEENNKLTVYIGKNDYKIFDIK